MMKLQKLVSEISGKLGARSISTMPRAPPAAARAPAEALTQAQAQAVDQAVDRALARAQAQAQAVSVFQGPLTPLTLFCLGFGLVVSSDFVYKRIYSTKKLNKDT